MSSIYLFFEDQNHKSINKIEDKDISWIQQWEAVQGDHDDLFEHITARRIEMGDKVGLHLYIKVTLSEFAKKKREIIKTLIVKLNNPQIKSCYSLLSGFGPTLITNPLPLQEKTKTLLVDPHSTEKEVTKEKKKRKSAENLRRKMEKKSLQKSKLEKSNGMQKKRRRQE